jgi:hypothetical protein
MVGSDVTIAIVLVPEVGAAYFPEYLIAERWARPGLEGKRHKCEGLKKGPHLFHPVSPRDR